SLHFGHLIIVNYGGVMSLMNFILDTGVRTTILTESIVAGFLELDSIQKVKVRGLGVGDPIDAIMAQNVAMMLPGGVVGKGINMLVLPEDMISYSGMFGKPVYGIIGYEIFGQFVVEINYHQKYIKLHNPFSYKQKRKMKEIPIEIANYKPYMKATIVDFRGEAINQRWLLDTGASNAITLFDEDLPVPDNSINAFLGRGLSGNVYGKLGRAPSFEFGEFVFQDVIAGYPDSASLNMLPKEVKWYGNIGSEILSRFTVVFNYHRGRMFVKKNPAYRQEFEYNVSGLEVISSGEEYDTFIISYVRPDSPADQAGLKVNDEIVAMNGFSLESVDITDVYGTLSKRSGRFLNLKIKRGKETLKARFKLLSEI
ncbi:MAG: PDZ domain-containing protein, partial [Bacteroidota bacterium]